VRRDPAGAAPARSIDGAVVVDLSSLWAGPLCGSLLALGGADVIKVESIARPDGARSGPPAFFDLMNAGKRAVALDFGARRDLDRLQRLIDRADVVIEASRRRALDQLGVDRSAARVWLTITGFGRDSDRVAFGDDAAVAGGLVKWKRETPEFFGDAVADPLSGLTAAAEVVRALVRGGRWSIDVAMAGVAAAFAGAPGELPPPFARPAIGWAPDLGQHTEEVSTQFGM
jgi:crotonobetainyl-CoA:carnitine CoA-transferase CaiB-like acyl-CoA transferase